MGSQARFPSAPLILAATSLVIFIVSALSGLLVAYAWAIAFEKFLSLALGILAAFCIIVVGRFDLRFVVPVALGFVALMLASNASMLHLETVQPPSAQVAAVATRFTEPVVLLLPLLLGWIATARSDFQRSEVIVGGTGLLALVALFLVGSGDVSSGLALLGGTSIALWLVAQQRIRAWRPDQIAAVNHLLIIVTALAVAFYIWVIASPTAVATLGAWLPSRLQPRLSTYHDFLAIIADYPFTGSGLAVSEMVYSSYLFMVQVPYMAQAHNLFLQLAVEQGIPGLIGFVGLLVATLWALQQLPVNSDGHKGAYPHLETLAAATVGSIVVLVINGMFDAEIYGSSSAVLLFVPCGVAWSLFAAHHSAAGREETHHQPLRPTINGGALLMGLMPLVLVVTLFFTLGGIATAYANAGAVAQTQAELRIYDWPSWSMQDQVRRTNPEQLYQAQRSFGAAIALNPYNVTAHWRLAQIELAQGDYATAEQHLIQAYTMAPHHRAVRQLLGELYATQGKFEQAIALWQPLDVGQNQLQLRQWWYEMIGDSARALNFQETLRIYEQRSCCS